MWHCSTTVFNLEFNVPRTFELLYACVLLWGDSTLPNFNWKLFISDAPIMKLKLGMQMNPLDIEATDDVYFECLITSNPNAYKVIWKHNVRNRHLLTGKRLFAENVHKLLRLLPNTTHWLWLRCYINTFFGFFVRFSFLSKK